MPNYEPLWKADRIINEQELDILNDGSVNASVPGFQKVSSSYQLLIETEGQLEGKSETIYICIYWRSRIPQRTTDGDGGLTCRQDQSNTGYIKWVCIPRRRLREPVCSRNGNKKWICLKDRVSLTSDNYDPVAFSPPGIPLLHPGDDDVSESDEFDGRDAVTRGQGRRGQRGMKRMLGKTKKRNYSLWILWPFSLSRQRAI